ncbi:ESX secretion-associated protein EspG [Actinokineospora sp.]|uniref:ESX secretion-associated protein EspG n=1 Tax=Actinokineospora sp. TaxID=1872133 RepID=UPI003D6AF323
MSKIELTWAEYDFLWEHFALGAFPPILQIDSHGRTMGERDELRRAAWKSLAVKDLGTPQEFDPRLERWFNKLVHPEWELDARLHMDLLGPRISCLIAWSGQEAAVAVLDAHHLTLWAVPSARVALTAVWFLPGHPPGTGGSITIPAEAFDAATRRAGSDRNTLARELTAQGLGKGESNKLTDVAGNVIRLGHFGAARTPRVGDRVRADHVVSVYDTHQQRYLFTRKPSGGRHWITLTPGTDTAIARQIDELHSRLPTR